MKHLKIFENFLFEMSNREVQYWALFYHIEQTLDKAKNMEELNSTYNMLRSKSDSRTLPLDAIDYFYKRIALRHSDSIAA